MKSYCTSVSMNCPSKEIFRAITKELSNWWGLQTIPIERKGNIFKVSWGEPWYQFKVIKYIADKEMIWNCIDANQKIKGLQHVEKEWVGTKIHWKLKKIDAKQTVLLFEHEGLIPSMVCFNFCTNSWDHFLQGSLVSYLDAS